MKIHRKFTWKKLITVLDVSWTSHGFVAADLDIEIGAGGYMFAITLLGCTFQVTLDVKTIKQRLWLHPLQLKFVWTDELKEMKLKAPGFDITL